MNRYAGMILATLVLVCVPVVRAAAQGYVIVDSVRLPVESYVGDTVELRYRIRTAAMIQPPALTPEPAWGNIESIRIAERDGAYDLRIVIIPYEPGTLTLPPIDLGGIVLEGLNLTVTSVLDEPSDIRAIYGPQRLPGTRAAALLLALAIGFPVALALYVGGAGRVVLRRIRERWRVRIPYRQLLRTIDRLRANIRHDTARDFYIALVTAIQDVMTSRLGSECRAATSTELVARLPLLAQRCGAEPAVVAPLAEIFTVADEAKFAHAQVRPKVRERHLDVARRLMIDLESSRRRLRSERGKERSRAGL